MSTGGMGYVVGPLSVQMSVSVHSASASKRMELEAVDGEYTYPRVTFPVNVCCVGPVADAMTVPLNNASILPDDSLNATLIAKL